MGERLSAKIEAHVRADAALLVSLRRHLHAHPELSGEENATTTLVDQYLRDLGLMPTRLQVGTGLVCDLVLGGSTEPDHEAPIVALRADLDALAMQDDKDVTYRSQVDGVAHACGHDVHTTVVVGAARVLAALAPELPKGTVRFLFEPSEESVPGGAVDIIAEGWLDGVSSVFGLHCDPKIDVGTIGTRAGEVTSAADLVEVRLRGPGGHTARPHLTVDLVDLLGHLVRDLQGALDEESGVEGALQIVFGAIRAGDAANVIPAQGLLRGTLRTRELARWLHAPEIFEAAVGRVLGGTGVDWEVFHRRGVPPVVNTIEATALLEGAVREALGDGAVVATEQSMGGDSFAWYVEKAPGSYARLGVHDPESSRPRLDLHAGTFDVDERAIGYGVRVLATAAIRALGYRRELTGDLRTRRSVD